MASSSNGKHWRRSDEIPTYMDEVKPTKNNRNSFSDDIDDPPLIDFSMSSDTNPHDTSDSSAEIQEIEVEGDMDFSYSETATTQRHQHQEQYIAIDEAISPPRPPSIHFEEDNQVDSPPRATLLSVLNSDLQPVGSPGPGTPGIDDEEEHEQHEEYEEEEEHEEEEHEEDDIASDDYSEETSKYKISQLVSIRDAQKFGQIEVVYGITVDMDPQNIKIEYIDPENNEYIREWYDVNDARVSIVTETPKMEEQEQEQEEQQEHDDDSSDDPLLNLISVKHEMLSLMSERQLLNIERDALRREKDKLRYAQKKHEMEVWTLKNDYIERTKEARAKYDMYKQKSDALRSHDENDYFVNQFLLTPSKLQKKEKWISKTEEALAVAESRAETLFGSATDLLQKVQSATQDMDARCAVCDEKSEIEKQIIGAQERLRQKHLNELDEWLFSCDTHQFDPDVDEWYNSLQEKHQSICEQRRKFSVVQRKLRTLHPQIYNDDDDDGNNADEDKARARMRRKLLKLRRSEKEWKLAVCEQIKGLFDDINVKRKKRVFAIASDAIVVEYESRVMADKERQIHNEDKMLRLQQKNVENAWMELQCERAFVVQTQANIDDEIQTDDRYDTLKNALQTKRNLLQDTEAKLQEALHCGDMLRVKLNHFEEWQQERWHEKEEKEENYQMLMNAMATLNREFEQMTANKDVEMRRMRALVNEWKDKSMEYEAQNRNLNEERNGMMRAMEDMKDEDEESITKNETLNEEWSGLSTQNEELKAQIQDLIKKNATDDEADASPSRLSLTQSVTESAAAHNNVDASMVDDSDSDAVVWSTLHHTNQSDDDEYLDDDLDSLSCLSKTKSNEEEVEIAPVATKTEIMFAKKIRKHRKVKDSRERSFLVMCDENRRIDCKALRAYIAHFGDIQPSSQFRYNVRTFLDFMRPNADGFVSFTRFVHAIDEDGDVVAAFLRFKQTGDPRSKN